MLLSPHFSLDELTVTDHREFDNTPPKELIKNLIRLAEFLEKVRNLIDAPIHINSAYRSPNVNAAVGSKPSSQHRNGCAADIVVHGMTADQVTRLIAHSGLPFDQLIREFDRWTHVSIPNFEDALPRGQVLIIDKTGTREFK